MARCRHHRLRTPPDTGRCRRVSPWRDSTWAARLSRILGTDTLAPDRALERAGIEIGQEHDGSAQQHGNEQAHRLTEHVAEGQHVQEAHGLKRTGPATVALDLGVDRGKVRADVSVAMDHALRVRGGPGREQDLDDVAGVGRGWSEILRVGKILQCPGEEGLAGDTGIGQGAVDQKAYPRQLPDVGHPPGRGVGVERDDLDAPAESGPEHGDPFDPVFTPEQEPVALSQALLP
jgi:hypothetical protein